MMLAPLCLVIASSVIAAAPQVDVAVVCPPGFREELRPWIEHRTAQGHHIALVDARGTADEIRARLVELARRQPLKYVLLVGDVPTPGNAAESVATFHVPAKVNVRWGSEPQIATDHRYADFDGDLLPDVAIGRLPADSRAELAQMIAKIIRYERNGDFGQWRRKVNFVAGLGGFGALADAALESAARKLITDGVPAGYSTSMTYGSWRSVYCPDPRSFRDAVLGRLNEGCLFWVYIGHGHRRHVDTLRVPGGNFPILMDRDVPRLASSAGAPIACFLACYAGAFDSDEDCLAEEMLRAPGGPVAVYAGSRVTMPYAMAVMGLGMLDTCFGSNPPATLGDVVLQTKRQLMASENLSANRRALDSLAALVSPAPNDLAAERAEHLDLFNLLGDPLLRLPQPRPLALEAPRMIRPGQTLTVSGNSDVRGTARVELVVRRDRLTFKSPARNQFQPENGFLAAFNEIYQKANDPCLASSDVALDATGNFRLTLTAPDSITGPCHVRVFVQGRDACALGHCDVEIVE